MLKAIIISSFQKVFFPVWVLLVFFILLDITTRLTNYEIKSSNNWKITSFDENAGLKLNQAQADIIIKNINNYQKTSKNETETSVNKTMSAAEQLAQQGRLSQLYSGDMRYRLVGIFNKSERFAVIQQLDTSMDKQKLLKVNVLENLQNYKITKILANKVILNSNDNRQISLYLYKKQDKSQINK